MFFVVCVFSLSLETGMNRTKRSEPFLGGPSDPGYPKLVGLTVEGTNQATPGVAGVIVLLFEIRAFYLGTLDPDHDFMMK